MSFEYTISLIVIGFLAALVKGVTGTGTSSVLVPLAALLISPRSAVVLSALVNSVSGVILVQRDKEYIPISFWGVIALLMVTGSAIGGLCLAYIHSTLFQTILAYYLLFISSWFLILSGRLSKRQIEKEHSSATLADMLVGLFAGFCGGFLGINAPPLVMHFGRFLKKQKLRRFLTLIFIFPAFIQVAIFSLNGMVKVEYVVTTLLMIPFLLIGVKVGSKLHHYVSEKTFRICLGLICFLASLRLLLVD